MTPTRREFLKQTAGLLVAGTGIAATAGCKGKNMTSEIIKLPASYYRQFDADFKLDVPGEGYGGWNKADIEISREHTALVVMHAWDMGTRKEFPGWHRAVEYIPRADAICRTVFPKLLSAVRESGLHLFHVVGGGDYYSDLPGYKRAVKIAGPDPPPLDSAKSDPVLQRLNEFRGEHVFVGRHNEADVKRGFERLDFAPQARPQGDEGIAENAHQLHALCRDAGVNHLIYAGFAINWCLLMSPGGMLDMSRRGYMCSVIRNATTAVENRESARTQSHKEEALWRVALAYGFVFDADDLVGAIR
ncbi:MAG: isochorismatase family protein [Armatimonadetes bacterium]|nr:isochorismatase family protein [Armatimonadota bacterium]